MNEPAARITGSLAFAVRMRRMRMTSLPISLLAGLVLLTVAVSSSVAAETAEPGGGVPRPGLCPPFAEPPARILPAWREAAMRDMTAAGQPGPVQVLEPSWDDEDWTLPALAAPPSRAVSSSAQPEAGEPAETVEVEADRAELLRDGTSRLEGDVWLQQGERFLSTESLEFNESTGVVTTLAPAQFGTRQLMVDSERATYNTQVGEGLFEGVEFFLPQRYARGEASVLARTGEQTAHLEGVKYTTCPPGDEDWWLKASSMDIDQEKGLGTGRNVRVAFMGVPFFYVPWISFPIDDRRMSGFLFPEFGSSGRNGTWLRTPYYLNLAPNYDATLAPHYMSERGLRMDGEFRYLFGWGQGVLEAEYLRDDPEYVDANGSAGADRYFYKFGHRSQLPDSWWLAASYQQVSDEEYMQDFSESGRATLISHLPQMVSLSKSDLEYGLALRFQRFRTIDPTIPEARRPYEKWPEVDYYYAPLALWDRLWFELDGESVNFQRADRDQGWRHHASPAFSVDLGTPALRVTPKLSWWHTEYDMTSATNDTLTLQRSLPVASMDISSRFARSMKSGSSQTLEPRLYYLHVPYRDQDEIPLFDTRGTSDSISSLFRENRFTGVDRVGDENRITLGLTSRMLTPAGREWFSAAIARAWHLEERRVSLQPSLPAPESTVSDYYGRLKYTPSERQNFQLDLSWDPGDEQINFGSAQYQFRPAETTVVNLDYLYRRDDDTAIQPQTLEQAGISFAAPVGSRWRVFGKAVYSLEDEHSQETMAGIEYENCCWVFRTLRRRYIFNREGEFDSALWFQLEFKGLSSVGRRVDEFLADDIYGYGERR